MIENLENRKLFSFSLAFNAGALVATGTSSGENLLIDVIGNNQLRIGGSTYNGVTSVSVDGNGGADYLGYYNTGSYTSPSFVATFWDSTTDGVIVDAVGSSPSNSITVFGGDDDDLMYFDSMSVFVYTAGEGNDSIELYGDSDATINGGIGDDTIACSDPLITNGVTIYGGDGNDLIYGSDNADLIQADGDPDAGTGIGNDTVYAGDGNDTISGYAGGFDSLYGEGGNDTFNVYDDETDSDFVDGGTGTDTVTSSDSNDVLQNI